MGINPVHTDPSGAIRRKAFATQGTHQQAGLFECIQQGSRGARGWDVALVEVLHGRDLANRAKMRARRSLAYRGQSSTAHAREAVRTVRRTDAAHATSWGFSVRTDFGVGHSEHA